MIRAELGVESVAAAIEAKAVQMANAKEVTEAGEHGGAREGAGRPAQRMADDDNLPPPPDPPPQPKNQVANGHLNKLGSNSAKRIVRRLKCDAANASAPNHAQAKDALAKLQSGTITSAAPPVSRAASSKSPRPSKRSSASCRG